MWVCAGNLNLARSTPVIFQERQTEEAELRGLCSFPGACRAELGEVCYLVEDGGHGSYSEWQLGASALRSPRNCAWSPGLWSQEDAQQQQTILKPKTQKVPLYA